MIERLRSVSLVGVLLAALTLSGCAGSPLRTDPLGSVRRGGEIAANMLTLGLWALYRENFTRDAAVPVAGWPPGSPAVKDAVELLATREYQKAINLLTAVISRNPDEASAYFYRAYATEELFRRRAGEAQSKIEDQCRHWQYGGPQTCWMNAQILQGQIAMVKTRIQADLDAAKRLRQKNPME